MTTRMVFVSTVQCAAGCRIIKDITPYSRLNVPAHPEHVEANVEYRNISLMPFFAQFVHKERPLAGACGLLVLTSLHLRDRFRLRSVAGVVVDFGTRPSVCRARLDR